MIEQIALKVKFFLSFFFYRTREDNITNDNRLRYKKRPLNTEAAEADAPFRASSNSLGDIMALTRTAPEPVLFWEKSSATKQ